MHMVGLYDKMGEGHPPLGVANENWWSKSFGVVLHLQESYAVKLQAEGPLIVGSDLPP